MSAPELELEARTALLEYYASLMQSYKVFILTFAVSILTVFELWFRLHKPELTTWDCLLSLIYPVRLKISETLLEAGSGGVPLRSLKHFGSQYNFVPYVPESRPHLFFAISIVSGCIEVVDAPFKGVPYDPFRFIS